MAGAHPGVLVEHFPIRLAPVELAALEAVAQEAGIPAATLTHTSNVARLATSDQAREVLGRVGLAGRMEAIPAQISGGERQRVAIARAIVHRPALLLCDEPTGNLDQNTANAVLELIVGLHDEGQTVLIITHDPNVAARGERTLMIRDGLMSHGRTDSA